MRSSTLRKESENLENGATSHNANNNFALVRKWNGHDYSKCFSLSKCSAVMLLLLFFAPMINAQQSSVCNLASGSCSNSSSSIVTTIYYNSTYKIGKPIYMALAYAPGCSHCDALNSFIANLSSKYDIRMTYINALSNQTLLAGYLAYYHVPKSDYGVVPILFVNNTYCVGDVSCISLLSNNISLFAKSGTPPIVATTKSLGSLGFFEITALALVDSINPCAFAVLIFLLSTLFMRDPNKRYAILLGGIAFAMGIFLFYFTIGILLVMGIKAALAATGLSNKYVYIAFGTFAVLLGLLNIKDYVSYGSLGFVMEVPRKWRPKMLSTIEKSTMGKIASIPGAFIAGIFVTAFLLPCITGPYFVAGSLLKGMPLGVASLWLAYYNILFIAPMLVITLLVYLSFTNVKKAADFRDKNIKRLHFVAGILLMLVGAIMFYSALT